MTNDRAIFIKRSKQEFLLDFRMEVNIMENYRQLFLDRWKELENVIYLEKDEDGK